jgi:hypothetical protein
MSQFGQDIATLATSPNRARKIVVKQTLLRPFSAPNTFSLPHISDENVYKAVVAVLDLYQKHFAGDRESTVLAAVASVAALGTLARQEGVNSHNVMLILLGVVAIAKRLSVGFSKQGILDALRLEYAHLRRDARADVEKRIGMALCLIEIIKICVADQVPGIVDSLLASGQGIVEIDQLPQSVAVTLKYYVAKHLMFLDDFSGARSELLSSHNALKPSHLAQQERVLFLLIPLQLSRGLFASRKKILDKYPRLGTMYLPLLRAVRKGNLAEVRVYLKKLECDFFILTRRIELIVYRRLVKKIYEESDRKRRVDMETVHAIFSFASGHEGRLSANMAEEIIANLIMKNLISGYLSYEEQALMLTGSNPFPPF